MSSTASRAASKRMCACWQGCEAWKPRIAIRSLLSLTCGLQCAATMSATDGGNYHDLPLLDFSVGLVENYVQASIGVSHVYVALDNAISQQDVGNPQCCLKLSSH